MKSPSSILVTMGLLGVLLAGCNDSKGLHQDNSMVKKNITLKDFETGQKISADLKRASINSKSWSFFGEPRKVEVVILEDGTVASIKFRLGSWYDGYKLKDILKAKFKEEGAAAFSFKCSDENGSAELLDKKFSVSKSICTANDGKQILEITAQNLRYEESFFVQNVTMKSLVDFSYLRLYDPSLLETKSDEDSAAAARVKAADLKRYEQENQRAKKDM
jgi:hypothetical protein